MRIALISRSVAKLHGYGGLERHVYELARFLADVKIDVTLFTMPPLDPEPEWDLPVRLETVSIPRIPVRGIADRVTNYPHWSARVGEVVAEGNFDLVHAQGLGGWGYARQRAAGQGRAPLVINPQGMEEFKTSVLKRTAYTPMHLMLREAAQIADGLIAADRQACDDIPRFLQVSPDKVHWIPNGIDVKACLAWVTPENKRRAQIEYGLGNRAPILLSVGRLEENKGFDLLLDCLIRLRPTLPSKWIWLLVGDGPMRNRLESKIASAGIADHAYMLGRVDDQTLHNLYELATLFIHPTRFEGSSLVTLEAMAHSRPIVATMVGGIPEKVIRGRNGFLARPGDFEQLKEKIRTALSDPSTLKQMGAASFQICVSQFDWSQTLLQTLALYDKVLGPETHALPKGSQEAPTSKPE